MKTRFLFLAILLVVCQAVSAATPSLSLIPLPAHMEQSGGTSSFCKKFTIRLDAAAPAEVEAVVSRFSHEFCTATAMDVQRTKKSSATMTLTLDASLASEAYTLEVAGGKVRISAAQPAGFFYALQTFKQLFPRSVMAGQPCTEKNKVWTVANVRISDAPRFAWRGFMLDEGRHFYGKEEIKRVLDLMSVYKMNRFHWHLTEDQGWRIEIKKYPRLTEVGAWRNSKVLGWGDVKPDGQRYGGFYSHADVKEIVAYAAERFIEIVPEVDIPGHSQAAVAAYPEFLACDPENPHEVWLWQGVSADVINVAEPRAVQFACDVIDELAALFPFGYIHLGGDECPTDKWERNALCQARLKEIGSEKYRDLQIDFYHKLQQHISKQPLEKQRKLIFWNEVLHGNTAPLGKDITIMAWIGADGAARDAAGRGFNTILSPQIPYYINRRQSQLPTEPRSQGHGTETVEAVYNYVPAKDVPENLQAKYLGVQANFWTEWVEDAATVEYLMMPRLAAVAEAGWTPQVRRAYPDFLNRLQGEAGLYELMGVSYGKHVFQ